jgi:hypothetical protein
MELARVDAPPLKACWPVVRLDYWSPISTMAMELQWQRSEFSEDKQWNEWADQSDVV